MNTIKRIMVATDFSAAGHTALARAAQIASQQAAELDVLHATPDWNLFSHRAPMAQEHYQTISDNAQLLLKREIDWLLGEYGVHARGSVHRGRASQVISRAMESHVPNLLVVGARGEHAPPIAPAALGGTTLKLISHSSIPLLIVREAVLAPYAVCLAAVAEIDEHAQRIVEWGRSLVGNGQCHVVSVFDVPYRERLRMCGVNEEIMDRCICDSERAAANAAAARLAQPGAGQVHLHMLRGRPIPAILTEITRYSPQFIAVGKHRMTRDEDAGGFMGCIGTRLAYHAPVDVLIVP